MRKLSLGGALVSLALVFTFAGCGDDSSNSVSADDVSVASSSSKAKGSSSSKKGQADPSNSKSSSSMAKKTSSSSMEGRSSGNVKSSSSSAKVLPENRVLKSPIRLEDLKLGLTCGYNESFLQAHGGASADAWDSTYADQNEPFITGIRLDLAQVGENGNLLEPSESIKLTYKELKFPQKSVNYDDMDIRVWSNVENPEIDFLYIDKDYRLYIYVYASNDTLGSENYNAQKFVTIDSVDIDSDGKNCVALEPYVTLMNPISFANFDVVTNGDRSIVVFNGSAFFMEELPSDGVNEPYFTDVAFELARVDEDGNKFTTPLSAYFNYDKGEFPRSIINFIDMDVRLEDPYKTECGQYRLMVYFYATNDVIGTKDYNAWKFVAVDSIDFDRPEEYCVVEDVAPPFSSSAPDPGPELVKKEASVTTEKGKGFSFAKGEMVAESEADVVFKVDEEEEGVITLVGVNGFKVAAYTNDQDKNYDDDWHFKMLPPEPAHLSDFRFTTESLESKIRYFANDVFFVAIGPDYDAETGENFYALTLKTKDGYDGDALKLIIIYYEKK